MRLFSRLMQYAVSMVGNRANALATPRHISPLRHGAMASYGLTVLLALSTNIHAAESVASIHFSGKILSSTGSLPPKLSVIADCDDERSRIVGEVKAGAYHIGLPAGVSCTVHVGERDWQSQPMLVFDAAVALPRTVLVYPHKVPEPELSRELIQMGEQDQALRGSFKGKLDADALKRAAAEDAARQQRLTEIIAAKGWPTISMVGFQAANSAWLIAQHTPRERKDQLKAWLVLMQAAADKHEILAFNLATTIDRVLVYDDKKQLYGTQYRAGADGASEPYPIEDVANLDQRRLSMGMSTNAYDLALKKRWAEKSASQAAPPKS